MRASLPSWTDAVAVSRSVRIVRPIQRKRPRVQSCCRHGDLARTVPCNARLLINSYLAECQ